MTLLIELVQFLSQRKKYWLIPLMLALVTLGALLVLAQGSVLAPFIYTLF